MVWFPNSWFYFIPRKKCIVAMFISCFKKSENFFLLREVSLLARCLMLNWWRKHAFIYATKTWNLWGFFTAHLQTKQMRIHRKNEHYFYFSLTLKDAEIFPKLLFWSDSWVIAPVFHNRFLIFNLYLMTVVVWVVKRKMAEQSAEFNRFTTNCRLKT